LEEQTVLRWAFSIDERAVGRGGNGGDVDIEGERGGEVGVPGDEGALVGEERFCYGWGR
jgi:hypothetical protein